MEEVTPRPTIITNFIKKPRISIESQSNNSKRKRSPSLIKEKEAKFVIQSS